MPMTLLQREHLIKDGWGMLLDMRKEIDAATLKVQAGEMLASKDKSVIIACALWVEMKILQDTLVVADMETTGDDKEG